MVGRPSQKVLRHVDLDGLSIDGFGRSDRLTFKGYLYLIEIILGRIGEIHLYANRSLVIIGCSDYVLNIVLRHILQPYRLPDARHSSVEDAARLEHLLAMRNVAVVGGVPNADYHRVLFALKGLRDIKSKRSVPTCMRPHLDVVHPHIRHPVDGTEMQQDATVFPVVRNGKSLLIPQGFLGSHLFLHTRKRRLDTEWHKDIAFVLRRSLLPFRRDGILPQAIEVFPFGTHHHRAGIFGQSVFG